VVATRGCIRGKAGGGGTAARSAAEFMGGAGEENENRVSETGMGGLCHTRVGGHILTYEPFQNQNKKAAVVNLARGDQRILKNGSRRTKIGKKNTPQVRRACGSAIFVGLAGWAAKRD